MIDVPQQKCAICEELFDPDDLEWDDDEADYVCYLCSEEE